MSINPEEYKLRCSGVQPFGDPHASRNRDYLCKSMHNKFHFESLTKLIDDGHLLSYSMLAC
jgi:hypothetical protein